ncbi:MAG: bifunctional diaminohydroxyphosphoribosylaminopyrimidine deaminase/5-amino-6-(5-phosphoribosylamino)uracil reductase RibD [Cellvibrionaceae bacterium]|nr:bifunctional diaminohydroxyphosphoribosylaminopyrimidine deaminase/5-amino-6-(5-phosphoribosylamino)uracil reductase RibD [Cellvibrionaceae bacterium]
MSQAAVAAQNARDERWMQRACELALQGLNTTTPNPRVGCVLVGADGKLLAEGFHRKAGEAHAEVEALRQAGAAARGATAYVTLEPCNHHGRTGPCSEALVAAGVVEVVYGMEDPNPRVSGQGLERLRAAGIRVRGPVLEAQVRALNPGFIQRMTTGRPWVRCKLAMSLDGRTAMASGESFWITGEPARVDVQHWRARSCAIVTGITTVLKDDPALTVRGAEFGADPRQPLRVVVDSRLRTPPEARLLRMSGATAIATCAFSRPQIGAEIWGMPSIAGAVDLHALVKKLAERGCNEVLVEAGPTLAGGFLRAGLIDELIIYTAPKLLGSSARPLFDLPLSFMEEAVQLEIDDVRRIGDDWRFLARIRPPQPQTLV